MKKLIILFLLALLFLSCAHGKTDTFPTQENPEANAHVYVIRDSNFLGWGVSLKVVLDDSVIAGLRSGEYISFFIAPGFHTLGVSKSTVKVPLEKENTYYFLISADYSQFGFELHRISAQQAQKWLAKTKPIE